MLAHFAVGIACCVTLLPLLSLFLGVTSPLAAISAEETH